MDEAKTTQALKQRAYIARRKANGICLRCPDQAMEGKCLCQACTVTMRVAQRKRNQSQPWSKGKKGRPPKYD